jgi:L-cysteine/cystine lyase
MMIWCFSGITMTITLPVTSVTMEQYRQQFPALSNWAYFNYGGQGPMPQSAIAAIHQAQEKLQQDGPFSTAVNRWIVQEEHRMREAIAAELGVTANTITLTDNVSTGCNIALWGIEWREGDHLLLSDCEHPGIIAAAEEIRRRFGVKVSTCPLMATLNEPEGDAIAVVTQNLRPTTRLVVISHILWNTGQVLPLQDIVAACHAYPTQSTPVQVLVDAAQSVGVLSLNLEEIGVDFYAFTGHKWWCGPAGLGGLYVRPQAIESLHPTFIGWRGVTKNDQGYPTGWLPDGRRYEVATADYALYAGLQSAIALHHQWGTTADRYSQIVQTSRYLWQRLQDLPHLTCLRKLPPESGLVSFQIQDASGSQHNQIVQSLEQKGFLLRTILNPNCIRACVHYFTTETECDRLVEALGI